MIEMRKTQKFKGDKRISIALSSSFVVLTFQYFLLFSFNLIGTQIGTSIQHFSKIIVALVYLFAFSFVFKRNKKLMVFSYLIAVIIFFLHYVLFPENREFIIPIIFQFFLIILPTFIYASSLINLSVFQNMIEKTSRIVFFFGVLLALQVFFKKASIGSYSMTLAYYMLLPAIILLEKLFERVILSDLIFFIFSLAIIFVLGSRGPLLSIFVFLIFKIIRPNFKTSRLKIIFVSGVLSLFTFMFFFLEKIMRSVFDILTSYGIYSRNLYIILDKRAFYLSGRATLYKGIIDEILKSPFIGIGIAADRRIGMGNYAHNILMELITNFGIIVGTLLLFMLLIIILIAIQKKNNKMRDILLLWICMGFVPLLISGSYLTNISFAILIGLLLNGRKLTSLTPEKACENYDFL